MKRIIAFCLMIAGCAVLPSASAGTKEDLMRIQKDISTLRDQIQELDRSLNEKTDGIKSLVAQLNDQVAKSNLMLEKIYTLLASQNANATTEDDTLFQEVRRISTKLDDAARSISAMARQLSELKVQVENQEPPPRSQSPDIMYDQAHLDYIQGKIDLAVQGFNAYLDTYPKGEKAADVLLNLGDAYLIQKKLPQANIAFTRIINEYSDSPKVPSALFKRAQVELAMQETQNAIDDLRNIIEVYPGSQEAENAKAKLQELGAGASGLMRDTAPAPAGRKPR
jgi:tol-pal system protein YbgF